MEIKSCFQMLWVLGILLGLAACGGGGGSGNGGGGTTFKPHLNDTGITFCADYATNGLACPKAGYPGQDGDTGRDVTQFDDSDGLAGFSFTRLDSDGKAMTQQLPDYATTPWDCVKDNVTGLTWEVKTNDAGLRDGEWVYRYGSGGVTYTCNNLLNGCDSDSYLAIINSMSLCGHKDWRLPSMMELVSIADYSFGLPGPVLDPAYFPHASDDSGVAQRYWSANPRADSPGVTWYFDSSTGKTPAGDNDNYFAIRLVRGGTPPSGVVTPGMTQTCDATLTATAPDNRYTDNRDGTVTDKATGLMWRRCPLGYAFSDSTTPNDWSDDSCSAVGINQYNWLGALVAVKDVNSAGGEAGHTDWRLPNAKELSSLTEYSCEGESVNMNAFPAAAGEFWSASPDVNNGSLAWAYTNTYGYIYRSAKSTGSEHAYIVRDAP